MSTAVTPSPPLPLERLEEPETIDDVLRNIDQILDWSINAQSNVGYFATLYKRVTVAIRDAINEGVFDDGRRMEQLDVAFARRYFNALNAYFYPDEYQGPTLPWEVAFVGDRNDQAIILQHMMTGLNAHITFDLGLAVLAVAANSLDKLENDFNRVNALLCSQIPGILDVVEQLSPEYRVIRRVLPNAVEVALLKRMVTKLRRSAWYFATYMDLHPESARERRVNQASWTAAMGAWYLQPPARLTPFPIVVRAIAKRESRNVAGNLRALETIKNTPEKLDKSYLRLAP
ncbi:MAG TPA: DUF5995 family protein [Mycobacterium sp.]|nr:DUF5995 family protein [Mycobacterium sp.]